MAINAAKYPIIVSTDFGCRFETDWLKFMIAPFKNDDVKIVGGAYGVLEAEQTTLAAKAAYILSGGYKVDVYFKRFIPSSRSIAYRKEVFEKVGGYNEDLTLAGDDTLFGRQLLAHGFEIFPNPHVGVYWGRHKKASGYKKEAYRYGLGDGEAKGSLRNFISMSIEMVLRYMLFLYSAMLIVLYLSGSFRGIYLLFAIPMLFGLRSYKRYVGNWLKFGRKKYGGKVFFYGLYLLEATTQQYISGYIHGRTKRK
jgi:GT2 family glycosyltransferase